MDKLSVNGGTQAPRASLAISLSQLFSEGKGFYDISFTSCAELLLEEGF